jgi:hypothetical protein
MYNSVIFVDEYKNIYEDTYFLDHVQNIFLNI